LGSLTAALGRSFCFFVFEGRADEGGEERVRLQRLRFEFWMELTAEEPGMIGRSTIST